jgi:putative phosphoribosyl transferase
VVLALPRGGVPVARVIADELELPLDLLLVRKLGLPWQPELAFGAIAEGGTCVLDQALIESCGLRKEQIQRVVDAERGELARRAEALRGSDAVVPVDGRTVIVVDDGLATGSTMRAAVQALRNRGAGRIVVAVPVGPPSTCRALAREADAVVCPLQPEPFEAVGLWYAEFPQLSDEDVRASLRGMNSGPA